MTKILLFFLCCLAINFPVCAGQSDDPSLPDATQDIAQGSKSSADQFRYNNKGNLTHVEDIEGDRFDLTYDGNGKIMRIIERSQGSKNAKGFTRQLIIKRNSFGLPVLITIKGVGRQRMHYDSQGRLLHIDNDQKNRRSFCGGTVMRSSQIVPIGKHDPLRDPVEDQVQFIRDKLQSLFTLANTELPL